MTAVMPPPLVFEPLKMDAGGEPAPAGASPGAYGSRRPAGTRAVVDASVGSNLGDRRARRGDEGGDQRVDPRLRDLLPDRLGRLRVGRASAFAASASPAPIAAFCASFAVRASASNVAAALGSLITNARTREDSASPPAEKSLSSACGSLSYRSIVALASACGGLATCAATDGARAAIAANATNVAANRPPEA